MSRAGECYENAMMESFFATLKTECAVRPFSTRDQARNAIFDYIETFYNRQRLHSALGYLSPEQFEIQFVLADSLLGGQFIKTGHALTHDCFSFSYAVFTINLNATFGACDAAAAY
jgi:hypothetical protein